MGQGQRGPRQVQRGPARTQPPGGRLGHGDRHPAPAEDLHQRVRLPAVPHPVARPVGEHHVDPVRGEPGPRRRLTDGPGQLTVVGGGFGGVVGVVRRGRAEHLGVRRRRLPFRRPPGVLHDDHRAALAQHLARAVRGERTVGPGRVRIVAQGGERCVAGHRVRRQRGLRTADDDRSGATRDQPPGLGQRVEPARPVRDEHAARALELLADGQLAAAGRVEPADGLVGGDRSGALLPQVVDLALPEVVSARGAGGDHRQVERIVCGRVQGRVVEGEPAGGQRQPRPTVGLHPQFAVDVLGLVEVHDVSGQPCGQPVRSESVDRTDSADPFQGAPPVFGDPGPGRGDHADAGDHTESCAHAASPATFLENTMADWNPPNPLPTDSACGTLLSRAVNGV